MKLLKWYIRWIDAHPFWSVAIAMLPFMPFFIVYWCKYHGTDEYNDINTWKYWIGAGVK
jgi:hypothetical protein